MPTVLITGCSSGFGHAIALHFLEQGWNVIATLRTPQPGLLPASSRLRVLALDVTDAASIAQAVEQAGDIDVLVNNAGIGVLNPLEAIPMATVREVFETNTLGTIALTQALLPQFRQRKAGVIVNVTSTVTLVALPLLAVYTASKAAVNAFTEVLALELASFGVRVRLVLPGRAPSTRFGENARTRMAGAPEPYAALLEQMIASISDGGPVTYAEDVAQAVWQAATDPTSPMRLPAGADAVEWAKA
ncbi:SDR family NAD(P)-dependent oxidoreductase [Pseudomonas sp. NPDC007930]|uniref:SDR family oxidoreductase n=1 Tax=Pseudomonas sp. NPDC007930 TaxID=3364417 RepID=UPI0036EBDDD0